MGVTMCILLFLYRSVGDSIQNEKRNHGRNHGRNQGSKEQWGQEN